LKKLLIPKDGFKDVSYKNWLYTFKVIIQEKFVVLEQISIICRIQCNSFKCRVCRAL